MNEVDLADRLARIEERLSELVRMNRERGSDHEKRILALERWKYALPAGMAATVSTLIQIFGK